MTPEQLMEPKELKKTIREQAHANRSDQPDKDELSQTICGRSCALPELGRSGRVMVYVDVRSEVPHAASLARALWQAASGSSCRTASSGSWSCSGSKTWMSWPSACTRFSSRRPSCATLPAKQVDVEELDLIMVPGVAFDRSGGRMGHGFGYYDKLLEHARPDAPLVALAFECQLFPEIPTQAHDIFMDKIITEKAVYTGKGR